MTARLSRWAAFPLVCTLLALLCIAPARAGGDLGGSGKFTGWWELGGYYGTDDASRGEVVLFTPLMQSATTLFFLDARGKFFEDDVQEGNIALGYRKMLPSGWNLGLWGGWDIRDTTNDNTLNQISFGVEALSERFDVRVNGYVPITDPKTSPSTAEVVLQGNNIFLIGGKEVALYGVDAEVGILLFGGNRGGGGGLKGAPAPAKRHELRAYAGGFWFDDDDVLEEVAGPKGRLEYRINDVIASLPGSRLTVESELSYDDVRDTRFEIGARLRVPFGARGSDASLRTASLSAQELRMTDGLERDTDIVTTLSKEENVIDNATNVALNAVSFAKNANQFAKGVNAGGNRLIILRKGSRRIDVSGTEGQQLQKNQTVQGGASTINMRGAKSGVIAPFTAPGKRPTLFSGDGNANTGVITVNNNTHVAGLNIRGVGNQNTFVAGNHGIRGTNNRNNIVIEQNDVRNLGQDGVRFDDGNSKVGIYNSRIEGVGNAGLRFLNANTDVVINGVTITDAGQEAIHIDDNNTNVRIANTKIINPDFEGIDIGDFNSNVRILDTKIIGGAQGMNDGIEISDFNDVTIRNVQIANTIFDGIDLFGSGNVVNISNMTIADSNDDGLEISSNNNIVTMNSTAFSGTFGGSMIEIDNNTHTLAGDGNIFNGTFGNQFCESGAQTGSFGFAVGPQATCP